MRDWHASAGGCTFAFRAVYMPWLALAWAIAVVSLIVFVIGIVRWRRQRFLAAIGLALVAMTVAGCNPTKREDSFQANVLFESLFVTCVVALAFGFVILLLCVILALAHRAMPLSLQAAGIVAMVMSLPTMGLSVLQILELGRERLPVLDTPSAVGFHVGQARHVKPQLFFLTASGGKSAFPDDAFWTIDEVVFEATAPGVVERAASARSGRFTVSTKVKAKAHRAEGNPYLPLQVGNEWHYERTTTSKTGGTTYFLFFQGKASTTVETTGVVLAIEAAEPRDGWREYTFVMSARGEPRIRWVVRPVDDETYFYDPKWSPPDEPDLTETDPKKKLQVLLTVDPGSTPVRGCWLEDVGRGQCQMGGATEDVLPPSDEAPAKGGAAKTPGLGSAQPMPVPARVPTQYALAGPSHLTATRKSDRDRRLGEVFSLGSVVPGEVSENEEYVLVRTSRGSGSP